VIRRHPRPAPAEVMLGVVSSIFTKVSNKYNFKKSIGSLEEASYFGCTLYSQVQDWNCFTNEYLINGSSGTMKIYLKGHVPPVCVLHNFGCGELQKQAMNNMWALTDGGFHLWSRIMRSSRIQQLF
jgi:hypothetical protein